MDLDRGKEIMTEFKKVGYLKDNLKASPEHTFYHYQLMLPEPLANWDVFDYWEVERVESMSLNLDQSDILFDVGAEHGWMSVVFSKFCQVFLIEPTKEFWPNIYQTWKANKCEAPIGCYSGLMSNKTDDKTYNLFLWPKESKGKLIDQNKYEYINQQSGGIKQMKLDDLVKRSGITPTALTIDVEGAELEVLKGAKKTLIENNLKVWVSIHPDLMLKGFDHEPDHIHDFMEELGYKGEHLATDHEQHWFYTRGDN